ncbi:hypothetical protein JCM8115_001881 [Rhodotorula mucilaginosa]|uniref:GH16 domain-containing protein n=1 Tax=Rhodotorula mucilaginosa TaxID=5537 RepID=A0A9P7B4D9_RHOMI|nr:hypothetical protein C6P46_006178 [Rhodotorula mucilaginosa]TKA50853.1 hypothetical protein B0A53_05929 [Rhodotorula sp. CCFEE 5036]
MRTAAALVALAATATVASAHWPGADAANARKRHSDIKRSSGYQLSGYYAGQDFLNLFDFATGSQNGGLANFVDQETAWNQGLVEVKKGEVHLRTASWVNPDGNTLNAIKLTSKAAYAEGLYLWDIARMPQVCGSWPAIWSTGPDWPNGGEIDLVEYVSLQSKNGFSVHTGPGCWAGSTGYSAEGMLAGANSLNCDAHATDSQGCGFRTTQNATCGVGANAKGAGVYALEWSSAGIKAWYFPRGQVPQDIKDKNPNPWSWSTPDMYIAAEGCNPSTYFQPQTLVVNSNICGTWPEGVWHTDGDYSGQSSGSCAALTGADTCRDYVLNSAHDFSHAYWRIKSFSVYNY